MQIIRWHFKMMSSDSLGRLIQHKEQRTEVGRSELDSWHCHFVTVRWTLEKSPESPPFPFLIYKWSDWTERPPRSFLPLTFCDLWSIPWTMTVGVLCFDILICHGKYTDFHPLYYHSKFKCKKLYKNIRNIN